MLAQPVRATPADSSSTMQDLWRELFGSLAFGLLAAVIFTLPLLAVGLWLNRQRTAERAALVEPFTDLVRRPAGESLRVKIDQLGEDFESHLTMLGFVGAFSAGMMTGLPASKRAVFGAWLFAVNILAGAYIAPRLARLARELRAHRLGYKGERVVAEELNRLLAEGFAVFHDLPFNGYNIDHVVVGTRGVFVVETKTRSKRTDARWEKKATAVFDGRSIRFNDSVEVNAVKQARVNAREVANWLSAATGERVEAQAILAVPGWWIDDAPPIDGLTARNPARIAKFVTRFPESAISPAQLRRIIYQVEHRSATATGVK